MNRSLKRHVVRTIFDESACRSCRRSICVGDHVWTETEAYDRVYCSLACLADGRADEKKRGKSNDKEGR